MNFETNPDGSLTQRPVVEYTTAPVAGVQVVLRLGYVSSPQQSPEHCDWYQVVLTPKIARELAQSLLRAATNIERPTPGSQGH